ncbi:MAG: ABC transporter permease [Candidatus Limnocylindrales bacterium]
MIVWLARRVISGVLVLLAVAVVAYLLTFVAPADPARAIAGPNASAAAVERIRVSLGLDRPALDQLAAWLGGLLRGDLGVSYQLGGVRVLDLILARLLPTIQLALAGVAVALAIGVPLGVRAATRPGGALDRVTGILGSLLLAVPGFLLGILVLYVLAYQWRLFPLATPTYDPFDLRALALPALTLGLVSVPFYLRVTRLSMLDELGEAYVRTARAKGLHPRGVVWRHAFRNAVLPVVTLAGLDLGFMLGGVVVIESVFGWPGIGSQAVRAISQEDLPVLMGTLLFGTLCIVVASLVVDLVHVLLDPRIALDGTTETA